LIHPRTLPEQCICGSEKIRRISFVRMSADEYPGEPTGLTCIATKFFAATSMALGVASLLVSSTQIGHTPSEWIEMSEYLSYNRHDATAVLDTVILDSRLSVGAGALTTFLCSMSLLAARKPVSVRTQYQVDAVTYSCACAVSVLVAFKLVVDVIGFNTNCQTALAQVDDKANPSMNSAGHTAFCEGLVYRMLTLCIVFITLATVTSLAWASNWCGVLCGCCCKEKAK
jgi:hypothetical protein